jgi:peptidyl-tRNA hydrolase
MITIPKEPTTDDPLIVYLVVRESLNMSIGKTSAQCGHAIQLLMQSYFDLHFSFPKHDTDAKLRRVIYWLRKDLPGKYRKVVCRADEKEWVKLKEELEHTVVIDSGLTEIEPNSETVLVFWPMYRSERTKTLKRLRLL